MKAILERFGRLDDLLGMLEDATGITLVVVLALVVNLQIFSRYLFHAPFIWPEEVARLLMIWIAFVGSAAVTRRGADMAVDTFVLLMPEGLQRALAIIKDLVLAALFIFIALQGKALADAVSNMPLIATGWPTSLLAWPLVVGGVLTAIHSLIRCAGVLAGNEVSQEIKTLT
ncbi:TRAP transporter small permease [Devosia ginsengisoli]|uniref:TRAP transporter small permease n=1 Tax=Devosia ginsengisoli TaxID=400770 RepID=UPI0026F322E6|nr:TRAP transporter small permease [Devosia ginsengisoli]MCR6670752.1 TRAP transporter small permease [Devosia ginsengisoli]